MNQNETKIIQNNNKNNKIKKGRKSKQKNENENENEINDISQNKLVGKKRKKEKKIPSKKNELPELILSNDNNINQKPKRKRKNSTNKKSNLNLNSDSTKKEDKEKEKDDKDKKEDKEKEEIIEKKITQNVSNILSFLAQISMIKNDFKNASTCYENGYYLNLGRYGAENPITEYFKKKLDLINEELKKYPILPQPKSFPALSSNSPSNKDNNNNCKLSNNFIGNIMHKGKADTFSFKIPTSSLYEPFLISLYAIGEDDNNRYAPQLYLGNLCFDKQKLAKYLRLKGTNFNALFYTDDNLNIILGNLIYSNGVVVFRDRNLKTSLISSSCPMKKK